MTPNSTRALGRALDSRVLAHAAFAVCAALLVLTAGQPIITDDLWWHLGLGRAFAQHGPWLAEDPLLFAPAGPPSPASWLADVALAGVADAAGFYALRALHAAIAAAILALAWLQLRRESGSRAIASLAATAFAALAAYRLIQLRPDLVSIAASLLCYRWLLADERLPSWRRIAMIAALFALWANLHAGFPVGLLLIGAAIAGLVLAAPLRPQEQRNADRARARRLVAALAASGIATLANPAGIRTHLAYLEAGTSTPALERVIDEWAPLRPFTLPSLPQPSPLAWALAWALILGVGWLVARWIARPELRSRLDPAKIAIALLSLGLLISALRFLWLGIFPLLLFARIAGAAARDADRRSRAGLRTATSIAAAACLLTAGFVKIGERMVLRAELFSTAYYQRPYASGKYSAHAIWLLADSGVRGNLHHDYFLGGFAGYWLAPDVRSLVNGTLNVPRETLDVLGAIALRQGLRTGEDFASLLDRLDLDLFLGVRLPDVPLTPAAGAATTAYLEDTPGWIPIFRNMTSALYLRDNDRNRANRERIARYYAGQGVPFDPQRGFDVDVVIRDAPGWAVGHGIVPHGFMRLARNSVSGQSSPAARNRLSMIAAVLGQYERAIAIDRGLLRMEPQAVKVRRRLVWSLLRLGRFDEAATEAVELEVQPAADGISGRIVRTVHEVGELDAEAARAAAARLPLLTRGESAALQKTLEPPEPRPAR